MKRLRLIPLFKFDEWTGRSSTSFNHDFNGFWMIYIEISIQYNLIILPSIKRTKACLGQIFIIMSQVFIAKLFLCSDLNYVYHPSTKYDKGSFNKSMALSKGFAYIFYIKLNPSLAFASNNNKINIAPWRH